MPPRVPPVAGTGSTFLEDVEQVIPPVPVKGPIGIERLRYALRHDEVVGGTMRITQQHIAVVHNVVDVVPDHFSDIPFAMPFGMYVHRGKDQEKPPYRA
jgi:hypothetical protein